MSLQYDPWFLRFRDVLVSEFGFNTFRQVLFSMNILGWKVFTCNINNSVKT